MCHVCAQNGGTVRPARGTKRPRGVPSAQFANCLSIPTHGASYSASWHCGCWWHFKLATLATAQKGEHPRLTRRNGSERRAQRRQGGLPREVQPGLWANGHAQRHARGFGAAARGGACCACGWRIRGSSFPNMRSLMLTNGRLLLPRSLGPSGVRNEERIVLPLAR